MKKIAVILTLLTLLGSLPFAVFAADPVSPVDDDKVMFYEDFASSSALTAEGVAAGKEVSVTKKGYLDMHTTSVWSNQDATFKRELSSYDLSSGKFSAEFRFEIEKVGNPNPDEPIGVPNFALQFDALGRVLAAVTQNKAGKLVLRVEENINGNNTWTDIDDYPFRTGTWYTMIINVDTFRETFSVFVRSDKEDEFTAIAEGKTFALYNYMVGNSIALCAQFTEEAEVLADYLLLKKGYYGEAETTTELQTTEPPITDAPTTAVQTEDIVTTEAPVVTTEAKTTSEVTEGTAAVTDKTAGSTENDVGSDGSSGIQPWIFIVIAAAVIVIAVIVILAAKKKKK